MKVFKIMGIFAGIGVACLLGLIVISQVEGKNELSPADEANIINALARQLRDPSSIEVSKFFTNADRDSSGFRVCGMVGGNNGFGAFAGFNNFSGFYSRSDKSFRSISIGDSTSTNDYILRNCLTDDVAFVE